LAGEGAVEDGGEEGGDGGGCGGLEIAEGLELGGEGGKVGEDAALPIRVGPMPEWKGMPTKLSGMRAPIRALVHLDPEVAEFNVGKPLGSPM
jgi:hypothetical protein